MVQRYSFAIVDFSRNNPYPSTADFLKNIRDFTRLDLNRIVVVARQDQRDELESIAGEVRQVLWIENVAIHQLALAASIVLREVRALLNTTTDEAILVASYNGAVLGEVQRCRYPNVDLHSLARFKPAYGPLQPHFAGKPQSLSDATSLSPLTRPAASPIWRFQTLISKGDAQHVLMRALYRRGAVDSSHAIAMQNLKPAMAEFDDRFRGSGYSNGTGGMIGDLVSGARFDGVIEAASNHNGTPYLWLTARGLEQLNSTNGSGAFIAAAPSPIDASTADVPLPTSPIRPMPPPVPDSVDGATQTNRQRLDRARSLHKSQRMQDALIGAGCGPRTKQRLVMLDRVGDRLSSPDGTLTDILDAVRDDMIQATAESPEKSESVAAIGACRKMLREFLPASKSLRDAKNDPLPLGFHAGPTRVVEVDSDWRMRTEAQLVLRLIAVFKEPVDSQDDLENIVGAIYHLRSGTEFRERKRQVESMIAYLLQEQLVHEAFLDGRRVLAIGPQSAGS